MNERRSDGGLFAPRQHGQGPREVASEPGALDEEFLYHLSRGSEFLIANQVVQAKEELERALSYRPLDARSQDLLASVYFRLGVYDRSIEIWSSLATTHDGDVALRVNLGLALLKTAQPELALTHLAKAVQRDPSHERAWRYVGLAEWRVGNLDRAREAFLRGGQASMARRMEEMLGSTPGHVPAQEAAPYIEETRLSLAPSAIRGHYDERQRPTVSVIPAARPVSSLAPAPLPSMSPAELEPAPLHPLTERPPATAHEEAPVRPSSPPERRSVLPDARAADEVFALTHDGLLIASPHRPLCARKSGLRLLVGAFPEDVVRRRARGRSDGSEAPALGQQDPLYRFAGQRTLHFAPPPGEKFELRRLGAEPLFVLERALFAFDATLDHESGALGGPAAGIGPSAQVVQLRGEGVAVLRAERTLTTVVVGDGEQARVLVSALVGWTGALHPSVDDDRWVVLRGTGSVLFA